MRAGKRCKDCGEEKPRDGFHRHPSTRDGLHPRCKPCLTKRVRESQRRHADPTQTKVCRKCSRKRLVDHFNNSSSTADGLDAVCKRCRNAGVRARRRPRVPGGSGVSVESEFDDGPTLVDVRREQYAAEQRATRAINRLRQATADVRPVWRDGR